jgi:hypothetical protein
MNQKNKVLFGALVGSLMMTAGCASGNKTEENTAPAAATAAPAAKTGECWGVNACKGKGDCGGKGHSCAGMNACKGKGWVKTTKEDCTKKKGKFKA